MWKVLVLGEVLEVVLILEVVKPLLGEVVVLWLEVHML